MRVENSLRPDQTDILKFCRDPDHDYLEKVRFKGIGEGAELKDENSEFRHAIISFIVSNPDIANLELVKELLVAEAEYSAKSWGTISDFDLLGDILIRKGGAKYLLSWLYAKTRSFDTECACLSEFTPEIRRELRNYLLELNIENLTDSDQDLVEYGLKLFDDSPPEPDLRGGIRKFLAKVFLLE